MVLSLSIYQTALFEASQEVSYVEVSKFSHSSNQALWLLNSKGNGASWQHEIHVGICVFFYAFMQNRLWLLAVKQRTFYYI